MVENAIVYAVGATFFFWKAHRVPELRWPLFAIALHLYVIVVRQLFTTVGWGENIPWGLIHIWTMRAVSSVCIAHFSVRLWVDRRAKPLA